MESAKEVLLTAALAAVALLFTVVGFFLRKESRRLDDALKRIGDSEAHNVTHDQLDRIMDRMSADRAVDHSENRERLQRIENKIDTNKNESVLAHSELRADVHALALEVAKGGARPAQTA